jgi:hypothetical protein
MSEEGRTGRPPGELLPERRRALSRHARRIVRLERQLELAREELANEAAGAAAEGASWRAIGDAVGLSKAAAGALVGRGVFVDEAD